MNKLITFIKIAINIFLLSIAIFLVAGIVLPLFKIQPLTIISGSMEPKFPVGSFILVNKVEAKTVKINDVISFKPDSKSDILVTHRVVGIDEDKQTFTTKGDNNKIVDTKPVPFGNLLGKVILCLPLLGYASYYLSLPIGKIIAVIIVIGLFVLTYLLDKLKEWYLILFQILTDHYITH